MIFILGEYESKNESIIQTIIQSSLGINIDEDKLITQFDNISIVNKKWFCNDWNK